MSAERVIIVGGGLAGLSAACELLERGCPVTLLEKQPNLGGNSSKATCGIAAPGSALQAAAGVQDSAADLMNGQSSAVKEWLKNGATDVEWFTKNLHIEDELVLRLGPGHGSTPRIIGTKTHFPGAVVTYAAVHVLQQIAAAKPERLTIITSAAVTKLLTSGAKVLGVEFASGGESKTLKGSVLVASGGFAGDASQGSVLAKSAPHLLGMPTTNDERASGDAIKFCSSVGALTMDLHDVEMTPLAAVTPGQESSFFKVVVSDAICGAGGKLIDAKGKRFVDELSTSDTRVQAMTANLGPFRLVIGEQDAAKVQWLVDFYEQRKIMKKYSSVEVLARELRVSNMDETLGKGALYVVMVTPALYSCVGGLSNQNGRVLDVSRKPIEGLFAAGEATAAPFPKALWSASGIPLLYAISSGRAAARAASGDGKVACDLRELVISSLTAPNRTGAGYNGKPLEEMGKDELIARIKDLEVNGALGTDAAPSGLTMADVAKHNTESDCWVVVNGRAYDVTKWLQVHPGGVQTITVYAGQDATDEWNCVHKPGTVEKNLFPKNPNGVVDMGPVSGAAAVVAAPATAPIDDDLPPPEGSGGLRGPCGALVFLTFNLLSMIFKTIFFTGNFKIILDNNRKGTIRSACFLVAFAVVHVLGNFVGMIKGPMEVNGEGYFFDRIAWTGGFGLYNKSPLSIVEEYLALALLLHVLVALKRSWDISLSYCLYTGRWNMMLSGLTLLGFLVMHLVDIRFSTKVKYTMLRPPASFVSWSGLSEGRVFYETDESIPEVRVRDLYTREVELFKDIGTCLLYTTCIVVFWLHMVIGWKKLVPADAMRIPKDHVKSITWLGWVAASAVAAMYLSVVWYTYTSPAIEVKHVA